MKIWIDDIRPAPEGYIWCKTISEAVKTIFENSMYHWVPGQVSDIELIEIDADIKESNSVINDCLELIVWLKETGRNYPVCIHGNNASEIGKKIEFIEKNKCRKIKSCRICENAYTNPDLTPDIDWSAHGIGECEKGFTLYFETGGDKPSRINFSHFFEGRKYSNTVADYVPKYCPECGRYLVENEKYFEKQEKKKV